jgi:hypothetical protein
MDNQLDSIQAPSIIPGCNNDFNSILSTLNSFDLSKPSSAKKNINTEIVKSLYERGYNASQIAKALKCSPNTILYHLNNIGIDKELDKHFVKNRVEVLQNVQRRLLTSIDPEEIKKTPVGSRVLAFAQLYDKERLETGQTTSNQALLVGIHQQARPGIKSISKSIPTSKSQDNTTNNLTEDISD